jgi:voltage-gated potassium channel
MGRQSSEFITFARHFFRYAFYLRGVLVGLLVLLFLGGFTISRVENLGVGDGIYFAFITGLSIGYGDITPATASGRVVSVFIGLVGMIFVGLTVAVATRALADSIKEHQKHEK